MYQKRANNKKMYCKPNPDTSLKQKQTWTSYEPSSREGGVTHKASDGEINVNECDTRADCGPTTPLSVKDMGINMHLTLTVSSNPLPNTRRTVPPATDPKVGSTASTDA